MQFIFHAYFSFWITENEDEGICQAGTGWRNRPRVPEEWLIYFIDIRSGIKTR